MKEMMKDFFQILIFFLFSLCFHRPKKPPFTYTELIEYALEDKKELTVSGIYNWIS